MKINIPKFTDGKVLVVGDLMLDKYWSGDTKRISPEAPVPIVKIDGFDYRAGGAANVALNMATLGTQVTIVGITGKDDYANKLTELLTRASISNQSIQVDNVHTITKLRVMSNNQQLIRLDFEDSFHTLDKTALTEQIKAQIPLHDVLLVSDYDKGTLSNVQELIQYANAHNVPVLVDPKGTDFSRYSGATIITPNMSELEAVIGKCTDDKTLFTKTEELLNRLALDSILVTRSEKGMSLVNKDASTLQLAAKAQEVYDVTGAGDTVIATLAACLAAKTSVDVACEIANIAAGIVVGKLGTASVTELELIQTMHLNEQHHSTILTTKQLQALLSELASVELKQGESNQGESRQDESDIAVLFGSFDTLTAKHIEYIRQTKKSAEQIVIAISEDIPSAQNTTQCVNTLKDRVAVVSAIELVDWVVAISHQELAELKSTHQDVNIVNLDERL